MSLPPTNVPLSKGNAHWTHEDEDKFLAYMWYHRSERGNGCNFKESPTWNGAARNLNEEITKGRAKTVKGCKGKWAAFKKIYELVELVKLKSGWTWTDDGASTWNDFVENNPDVARFWNKGWQHLATFSPFMVGVAPKGTHVFHASQATPTIPINEEIAPPLGTPAGDKDENGGRYSPPWQFGAGMDGDGNDNDDTKSISPVPVTQLKSLTCMVARLWSNSCYSVIGLLALVNDAEPIALWNARVGRDFYPPRDSHNIYTTADPGHPFECIVFGKISKCINVEGNCRIILECDENCGLAAAVKFAEQVDAASGPARYDEPHQLPVHLYHDCAPFVSFSFARALKCQRVESCMFYAGNADCSLSFSPDVLEEGAWAVGVWRVLGAILQNLDQRMSSKVLGCTKRQTPSISIVVNISL
ncbi:hypothetical protein C8J57DRAFT_1242457 [Mycena rebaudengoi]|nr:hypothetical protein C8J57DRAFT_1242457 [Mycena rebaudengoi]